MSAIRQEELNLHFWDAALRQANDPMVSLHLACSYKLERDTRHLE